MLERPYSFTIDPFHPLAQGLVFFGGGAMAGSSLYKDSSLYGNDGTLNNGVSWEKYYLKSTSGNSAVTIPQINLTTNWTVSAWVRNELTGTTIYIGDSSDNNSYLYTSDDSSRFRFRTSDSASINWTTTIPVDTWIHWVAVGYTTSVEVFRNAVSLGAQSCTTTFPINQICNGYNATTYALVGNLRDPIIHNRALSLPEIQTLANPADPMLGGLILPPARRWWPVSGGAAPTTAVPVFMHHRKLMGMS